MNTILDFIRAAAPWVAMSLLLVILSLRSATNKNKTEKQETNYSAEGMSLGMCLGLLTGTALGDSIGIGILLGASAGLTIGICIPKETENRDK